MRHHYPFPVESDVRRRLEKKVRDRSTLASYIKALNAGPLNSGLTSLLGCRSHSVCADAGVNQPRYGSWLATA
jgi:hypothetical protein